MRTQRVTCAVFGTFVFVTTCLFNLASPAAAAEKDGSGGDYRPSRTEFDVESTAATFTDASRSRDLPVRIYAPALKYGNGPFAVVVFSHGGGESRASFDYLGKHWAGCGYIALFSTHAGTDRTAVERARGGGLAGSDGSGRRFELRPQDVRFAVDFMLGGNTGLTLLDGRVNPDRLGIAGQCMGSTTALAMVGLNLKDTSGKGIYADSRFKAAVALSPQPVGERSAELLGLHDGSWDTVRGPVLVVTGTKDFLWVKSVRENSAARRRPYDGIPEGPKHYVEIAGAEHHAFTDSEPWYPVGGPRDPRHHGWIQQATMAFFDAYLPQDKPALEWLRTRGLQAATQGECRQGEKLGTKVGKHETAAVLQEHDFTAVDAFLEKSLPRIDGGCGLILIQGDRVIYRKAFGTFTTETVVPIASASKWISGGVIMALVDDGTLHLDDKASQYLPEFKGKKGEITIRQMFSHTHGFPDQPTYHRDTRLTMAECVQKIVTLEPVADPGTILYYSGTGIQMAGYIATLATGKPWEQIFKEKIGEPLGMSSTTYYAFGQTKNPNVAGSIETCIDDYGAFVTMVLNRGVFRGSRVLSEEAVETMLSVQSGDVPIRRHPWQAYTDFDPQMAKTPYGIGCWLEGVDAETGKAWRASSGGAFGCQPVVDLKRNVAGVFLPNARTMKRSSKGLPYNDASVVYLELRELLNGIFDGKPVGPLAESSEPTPRPAPEPGDSRAGQQLERILRFATAMATASSHARKCPSRCRCYGALSTASTAMATAS